MRPAAPLGGAGTMHQLDGTAQQMLHGIDAFAELLCHKSLHRKPYCKYTLNRKNNVHQLYTL